MKKLISYQIILLLSYVLLSCSAEKKALPNRIYHNTTAKYNAYYIAREQLREIENDILEKHENNYNSILRIHPVFDSTTIQPHETKLNNVIKMSSIAIQRHKNSKWVDDSYILVGQARYYLGEFPESIETLKYVNVKSEKNHKKHRALIKLIRTFTDYGEYNNAIAVIDYLRREKMNRVNSRAYHIEAAHFHQVTGNVDYMVRSLSKATELSKTREDKARLYFIIGQIYQALGYESAAYENYSQALKNKPNYELYFYAGLNMAQVTELGSTEDARKVRKYFTKLLKDGKNKEFKDKIYYELAEFEYKMENMDDAIEAYKNSIAASQSNPRQKGYSYWKLGKIYFEDLKNYDLAKSYYDSTVQTMPKDEALFESIAARHKVLAEFIEQIVTIELQDSLLYLASLDSLQLNSIFAEIQKEKDRLDAERKKLERKQKARAAQQQSGFGPAGGTFGGSSAGTWYFYNPVEMGSGNSAFIQKWGNRKLEDHWRRSTKQSVDFGEPTDQETEDAGAEIVQLTKEEIVEAERQVFFASIPFTEEAQVKAHMKIENAHYKLGNIYNFDLSEKSNAANTFLELLRRYPETEYRVEVLYLLYIYFKDKEDDSELPYKNEILEKYPNSIYAKIIINPDYKEESENANKIVKELYEKAYRHYENQNYAAAESVINQALNDYSENDFTDNLHLLKVLIKGRTEGSDNYKFALGEFIEEFPDSELIDYAKKLIAAIERVQEREAKRKGQQYLSEFNQKHYFILLYESNRALATLLPAEIEGFSNTHFANEQLNAGNLVFDEKYSMILLSEISTKQVAIEFFNKFNSDLSPVKDFGNVKFYNFVITKDNFEIFYQAREHELYRSFFEQNYLK